jgi:mannan endo-1,6-alpha-mannosidase
MQMVEYWWAIQGPFFANNDAKLSSRYYTGDNTYNEMTKQALLFQVGPNNNYEPENQTRTEV